MSNNPDSNIQTIGLYFETKYFGPTDSKGSHIKATYHHVDGSKTVAWSSWKHELDGHENHLQTLRHLLDTKLKYLYGDDYNIPVRAETIYCKSSFAWQVIGKR